MTELIHVATITQPHGLKGQFKLHCLLDSADNLCNFSELYDEHGKLLELIFISLKANTPIAALDGVMDRNGAEALKQTKIFARADGFPPKEDGEFYPHELRGLELRKPDGAVIGTTLAFHNFGAGDILEIEFNNGQVEMFPFIDEVFPDVDVAEGYVSFIPPEYLE